MKKALTIFILSLGILPGLALATSTIALPEGFTGNIWDQVNSLLTGLSSYISLIVGTILALVVIGELIIMLRSPNK